MNHRRTAASAFAITSFTICVISSQATAKVTWYFNSTSWKDAVGTFEARAFDEFYPSVVNPGGCLVGPPGPTLNLMNGDVTVQGFDPPPTESCALTDASSSFYVSDGLIAQNGSFEMEFHCAVTAFFTLFASLAETEEGTMELFDSSDDPVATFSRTSTHNGAAHGIGFISLIPIKRIKFTSSEAGPTIVGAFTTIGAGLGTVEIPKYSGPNGTTVEHDFACVFISGDFLEIKKFSAFDTATDDHFGEYVGISGDTVVVGVHRDDDVGENSGSAYIFKRNQGGADNWGEVKKLTASDGAADDWFGQPVAISGDTVIIGSLLDDHAAGNEAGSAYIFSRDHGGADNWGEVKKLTASDAAASDRFGTSVNISGDWVIVGASLNSDAGSSSGSAYIFARNQGGADNWGEVKKHSLRCSGR